MTDKRTLVIRLCGCVDLINEESFLPVSWRNIYCGTVEGREKKKQSEVGSCRILKKKNKNGETN